MLDKILAWCGNALLAAALITIVSQNAAYAQDGDPPSDPVVDVPQPSGRISVPLSGGAAATRVGNLLANPNRVETGLIEIGDSKTVEIELAHIGATGSPAIRIESANVFGKNSTEYVADFGGFVTLNPGDRQTISITFTPTVPGPKSAGLMLDIESKSSPYVILFSGESRYPFVSDLGSSDAQVNFGQIIEGGKITKNFLLTNLGKQTAPAVTISSIELGGDFPGAFEVDFQPTTIAPGETLDVPVTLSAPTEGTKSADVSIIHDGNNDTIEMSFAGEVVKPSAVPVSFTKSDLAANHGFSGATALDWGPDGKLYVTEASGLIHVFNVTRNGKNNYSANKTETITSIKNVPNHDDDGEPNSAINDRLVTGIHVTGTAATPEIWLASSDPRQGGGAGGTDKNLDTNSGILHKLVKTGGGWQKTDVVRGLPRSEENHAPNGLVKQGNKILILIGGHTNEGVPSNNFAETPEYALSGALLEIDLGKISGTYDLPTLDDEDRPGGNDANDPFGGNDGKNQAKLVDGGPVQIYYAGLRNAYGVALTESNRLYTFDNGSNTNWGGAPGGDCLDDIKNGGNKYDDNLHLMNKGGYGGHPNPTRGNKNNKFNPSNPQTPIEGPANPQECVFKQPGQDGSLTTNGASSNGLDEYTATNFAGAMYGNLIAASLNDDKILRIQLNGAGNGITSKSTLATISNGSPLGLVTVGDSGPFPGTIWVANYGANKITVLEPADY